MTDTVRVERLRALAVEERGLAVVSVARDGGIIHSSVVNAALVPHPLTGVTVAAFVSRSSALKVRLLRRRPQATILFRRGSRWLAVDGTVSLFGPDDRVPGVPGDRVPEALRDVYRAPAGEHDNWPEYDRAMVEDRRTAVYVALDHLYGNS